MVRIWIKWEYEDGMRVSWVYHPMWDGPIERYEKSSFYTVVREEVNEA